MEIYNKQQKMVGNLKDGVYYTNRRVEHFMIRYGGFGISKSIIDILTRFKCIHVKITYYGKEKMIYHCPLSYFINSHKMFNFEDNDLQYFVSVKDMEEYMNNEVKNLK